MEAEDKGDGNGKRRENKTQKKKQRNQNHTHGQRQKKITKLTHTPNRKIPHTQMNEINRTNAESRRVR